MQHYPYLTLSFSFVFFPTFSDSTNMITFKKLIKYLTQLFLFAKFKKMVYNKKSNENVLRLIFLQPFPSVFRDNWGQASKTLLVHSVHLFGQHPIKWKSTLAVLSIYILAYASLSVLGRASAADTTWLIAQYHWVWPPIRPHYRLPTVWRRLPALHCTQWLFVQ